MSSDDPRDERSRAEPPPSRRSGAGLKEGEDRGPGHRPATGTDDPRSPGGIEQPKNDRRKRGDLQKRGLS